MNPSNLCSALLLATLASAQTLSVSPSVSPDLKTWSFKCNVVGAPGATVGLLASLKLAATPLVLPFGTVHLDLASLVQVATFTLNGVGFGSVTFSLPATVYKNFAFDLQAGVVSGGTLSLTSYAMLGGYANLPNTEILGAAYDGATDSFYMLGKGPSGALIEVFRKSPAGARVRLVGTSVPYSMMALGIPSCMFVPGEYFEVYLFGTSLVLRLE